MSTILLGTYWHFQTEIGWSYVDGVGVAYTLLAAALLTRAWRSVARSFWLVVAGAAFACAMNTNFVLVETILPLFVYHLGTARINGTTKRQVGRDVLTFLAGALVLTAILGVYFYSATHTVLYTGSFRQVIWAANASGSRSTIDELGFQIPPFSDWITSAHWLEVPMAVAGSAILYLILLLCRRTPTGNPYIPLFQVVYLVHATLFVIMQHLLAMYVLLIPWYAVYLLPFAYLALAGLIYFPVNSLRHSSVAAACAVGIGVPIALFAVPPKWREFSLFPAALGLSIIAGYAHRGAAVVLILVAFGFYNYTRERANRDTFEIRKSYYLAVTDSISAIKQERIPFDSICFWYKADPNNPVEYNTYISLNAAYMWGYSKYPAEYPNLCRDSVGLAMPPKPFLAILTKGPGAFETARNQLREVNVDPKLLREERITRGDVSFTLTLIRCDRISEPARVP